MNPGSIVRCRNREWVMLPSDDAEILRLRPLTGVTDEVVEISRQLMNLIGSDLPGERIEEATFPPPTPADLTDASGSHLLWQAARLTLREGAGPFRSLGRISVRPRIYQFVPMLMALRLDPVRMLIADDVGVGKTIESLMIAKEMLERGEIQRLCVLCPPYLCDQWQRTMIQKFNLDAVVIRSGTVGYLDRHKATTESIYRQYPIQVASIDFVKTDHNRHIFLQDCPELVIIDEAHGSAVADGVTKSQHQRHELVRELSARADRHLIMLTATPHSGIESAFRSLLAFLRPEFGGWDAGQLTEPQRTDLAKHFVQRTRKDIESDWDGEHCFPKREAHDATFKLSPAYTELFDKTYDFCSEMIQSSADMADRKQRVRYWAALALLRCVMSSPEAALAALEARHGLPESDDEPDFRSMIFESTETVTDDDQPTPAVEAAEVTLVEAERRKLRDLGRLAKALLDSPADTKLQNLAKLVADLIREGFHPIVWCRYIATAEYVAAGLQQKLGTTIKGVRVSAISSRTGDEEVRAEKLKELAAEAHRVLVATDCLSEGIDLQESYNAVIHYDLPWNPNRMEQREGRVDRYGQTAPVVKTIRYWGEDNPVDGIVIDVLLNKAQEIYRALGTHVPIPEESETVTDAVLKALFLRGRKTTQFELDLGIVSPQVVELHKKWQRDAEREKVNRTRFAQRAIKPAEVRQELESVDEVLGDPAAVQEFILSAAQRLGLTIMAEKEGKTFRVAVGPSSIVSVPEAIRFALPTIKSGQWHVTFVSPSPEGAEYLGRNHPFVAAMARYLLEEALTMHGDARASRCGVIATRAVTRLTTILLLRVRYLVQITDRPPLLSEEVLVRGYTNGSVPGVPVWLGDDEALSLLARAQADANIETAEKRERVEAALREWPRLESALKPGIKDRADELDRSHRRVRQSLDQKVRGLSVKPQLPPDLLGILVLQPVVGR